MTEFKSGVDLSLMEGVLRQYQEDATSLIMILQQAQSIYGYLPQEVIYHVAQRTGNSPAKVMGVATFYSYFRLQPMGSIRSCSVMGRPAMSTDQNAFGPLLPRNWESTMGRPRKTECLPSTRWPVWAAAPWPR